MKGNPRFTDAERTERALRDLRLDRVKKARKRRAKNYRRSSKAHQRGVSMVMCAPGIRR